MVNIQVKVGANNRTAVCWWSDWDTKSDMDESAKEPPVHRADAQRTAWVAGDLDIAGADIASRFLTS